MFLNSTYVIFIETYFFESNICLTVRDRRIQLNQEIFFYLTFLFSVYAYNTFLYREKRVFKLLK